jgi:hypothetical protein
MSTATHKGFGRELTSPAISDSDKSLDKRLADWQVDL